MKTRGKKDAETQSEQWVLQMKHDLDLAKKIALSGTEQTPESLILSGILFGRMLERDKIQHFINKSHVDIADDTMKQLLKL